MISEEEYGALKRAYERERTARKISEKILEEKATELFDLNKKLQTSNEQLEHLVIKRTIELERIARIPDEDPSPILRITKDGTIEYCNPSGRNLTEFLSELDIEFKPWVVEALSSNETIHKKLKVEDVYYEITIVPIPIEGYVNLYFFDNTKEIETTEKLEVSEERYRSIVEGSRDLILKLDRDGDVIYVNGAVKAFFEVEDEQVMGASFLDFIDPDDRYSFRMNMMDMVSGKTPKQLEIRVHRYNNEYAWLQIDFQAASPYYFTSFTITARDITERRIAQEQLTRSEDLYKRIIENMQLGLLEVDTNNVIVKAYEYFCKLSGYSPEELIGKRAMDVLLNDEEAREVVKRQQEKRYLGVESVYESMIIKKNGEKAYVLISGAPLYDDQNRIYGSIGIHLDVTRQKEIESELISARLRAEESTRSKERFLANMSHEIRTPMNAILGMSDLMLKSELSSKQNRMMEAIHTSSRNLLVIINDILDLSKIEAGKMTFEQIGFDLKKVFNHIVQTAKLKSDVKDLFFEAIIDPSLPEVLIGDPHRLNQILLNLLSNAIKFTDTGKVSLTFEGSTLSTDIILLEITVRDTGRGIDSSKIDKIFQPFDQEDNSVSRIFGGTGLGLTITQQLVEQQNGKIAVSSKLNEGSTFSVSIPYLQGNKSDIPKDYRTKFDRQQLNGLRVAIAEDNKFNQTLIENIFEPYEVELFIANNGQEVIDELNRNRYDIVLMDIQMPVLDGIQATKHIRSSQLGIKHIPIVALTANAFKEEQQQYLEAGMNACISKPFDADELFATMIKLTFYVDNSIELESEDEPVEDPNDDNTDSSDSQTENNYDMEPSFSIDKLHAMSGGNDAFVQKMVDSFKEHTPEVVSALEKAIKDCDWDKVGSLAHRLKASLNTFAMDREVEELIILEKKQDEYSRQELIEKAQFVIRNTNVVLEKL